MTTRENKDKVQNWGREDIRRRVGTEQTQI